MSYPLQWSQSQFTQSEGIAQDVNEFTIFLRTVQNEIHSPVLERYDALRVSHFKQMIENQQQVISNLKNYLEISSTTLMQCQIFQMEIARLEYYLTLYAKTRLRKIHEMARNGIDDTTEMTTEETTLFNAYKTLRNEYLEHAGIEIHPEEQHTPLESFVFVRVLQDVTDFKIHPSDDGFDLTHGEVYLFPYSAIQAYIHSDTFELI